MKSTTLFLAILISSFAQFGCGEDNTIIARPGCDCDVADTFVVDLGGTFTISLLAAYSAGEWWEIEVGFDEKYVELESYSVVSVNPDDELDGTACYQNWKYRTREQGIVCAKLLYRSISEERMRDDENIIVIIE